MCLLLAGCLRGGTPAPRCPRRAFGARPRVWDGEEMVWMGLPKPSWYLVALPALQELCRVACPGEVPLLGATLPERAIPPRWSFSAGLGCVPLLPAPFWPGKPSRGKCLTLAQSPAALPSFWGHLIYSKINSLSPSRCRQQLCAAAALEHPSCLRSWFPRMCSTFPCGGCTSSTPGIPLLPHGKVQSSGWSP